MHVIRMQSHGSGRLMCALSVVDATYPYTITRQHNGSRVTKEQQTEDETQHRSMVIRHDHIDVTPPFCSDLAEHKAPIGLIMNVLDAVKYMTLLHPHAEYAHARCPLRQSLRNAKCCKYSSSSSFSSLPLPRSTVLRRLPDDTFESVLEPARSVNHQSSLHKTCNQPLTTSLSPGC